MDPGAPTPSGPVPSPSDPVAVAGPRRRRAGIPPWLPLVVVAVAWLAHGGVLSNGFVWDDAIVVRDDSTVARGFAAVPGLLTEPWGGRANDVGLYRPLVAISLAVQAGLHGTATAFPFHVVNLFLHASVATALLALLLRVLPGRPAAAAVAALLFAALPVHAGTVSWIVARGDLLVALLGLLAALVWTKGPTTSLPAALLAGLLWFGALLAKESALVLPAAFLVADAAARGEGLLSTARRRLLPLATLLLPAAAWFVLRQGAVGGLEGTDANAALAGRNLIERAIIGGGALVRTAAKILFPAGLTGDGSNDPILSVRTPISFAYVLAATAVGVAAVAALVLALLRRAGPVAASVGLFVVLSLPVLQLVPIGAVFEDRFAYVPSLALLVPVGILGDAIATRARGVPARAAALGLLSLVLGAAALASWRVAADWRDDEAFDRALLREDPAHLRAASRLSRTLVVLAGEDRRAAAAIPTGDPESRRLVEAYRRRAALRAGEAVALLERVRALPAGMGNPSVLWGLGDALLALPLPRYADAKAVYGELLRVRRVRVGGRRVPIDTVTDWARVASEDRRGFGKILHNLGIIATGMTEPEESARRHEAASLVDPSVYAYARAAGASIWRDLGDPARALPFLERAALLAADEERPQAEADVRSARAVIAASDDLFARGAVALGTPSGEREARQLFEELLRAQPRHVAARVGLARAFRLHGNFRDALGALDEAAETLDADPAFAATEKGRALAADVEALRARWTKERDEEPKDR